MNREEIRVTSRPAFRAAAALAIGTLLAFGCGGGGNAGSAPTDAAAAGGRQLYLRTCATCHGADGHGMPRLGKDLHDNVFTKSLSDEEMVDFLKKGRPAWDDANTQGIDMPPKGGNPALTDEDLLQIIAFLRTW